MRDELRRLDVAAARVGDRWTLLVVATLLDGPRRFGELQDGLPGLAPNVLSKRLKVLEADGLIVSQPYSQRPVRVAYRLTDEGAALAGALRLLSQWAADHREAEPATHGACGTPVELRAWCPTCAVAVEDEETTELHWL